MTYVGVDLRYGGGKVVLNRVFSYDAATRWPIANPILRSGRWPAATAVDEIVLDHSLASAEAMGVGDQVTVERGGRTHVMRVVGTALDFTDCFVPDCSPSRSYVSESAFGSIAGPPSIGSRFLVRVSDLRLAPQIEAAIREKFGEEVGSNTWPDTRSDLLQRDAAFGSFLQGFGLFSLVAAALVAGSALTAERRLGGARSHC